MMCVCVCVCVCVYIYMIMFTYMALIPCLEYSDVCSIIPCRNYPIPYNALRLEAKAALVLGELERQPVHTLNTVYNTIHLK
jgi:hypothetical protein